MTMKNVLVPLDLSPAAHAALAYARVLVEREGSLHLLHVIDSTIDSTSPRHSTPREMEEYHALRQRDAEAALARAAVEARRPGIAVTTEVRMGAPADEILAASERFDLVALGAHGRSLLERLVVGSVAEDAARRANVPVLVAREAAQPEPLIERVVAAVDLTPSSREAARVAAATAQRLGKPLVALHVFDERNLSLDAAGGDLGERQDPEAERARSAAPAAVAKFLEEAGAKDATVRLVFGNPTLALVHALTSSDLVVCGTHGRGVLGRIVFGSIALNLLRHSPAPVLVVHAEGPR